MGDSMGRHFWVGCWCFSWGGGGGEEELSTPVDLFTLWWQRRNCCLSFHHGLHGVVGMIFYAHTVYVVICYMSIICYIPVICLVQNPPQEAVVVFGYIQGTFLVNRTGCVRECHEPCVEGPISGKQNWSCLRTSSTLIGTWTQVYGTWSQVYGTRNCKLGG